MSKKYKINFNNKVLGPYEFEELKKLIEKGYIPSFVRCTLVDKEQWHLITELDEFSDLFTLDELSDDETILGRIEKIEVTKIEEPLVKEFVTSIQSLDHGKLKRYKDSLPLLATIKDSNEKKVEVRKKAELPAIEKTSVINLEEMKQEYHYLGPNDDDSEQIDQEELRAKKSKKIIFYTIFVVLFVLAFLIPDNEKKEEKKDSNFIQVNINFPINNEVINNEASQVLFEKGAKELKDYSFKNINQSAESFRLAYEQSSENKEALIKLVLAYSLLLKYTENLEKDAAVIYNLFKVIGEGLEYNNLDLITAKSYFYYYLGKYKASILQIDKYLSINKEVSPLLFAVYLNSLLKGGDLVKSRKVFNKIEFIENKNIYVYESVLNFLKLDNNFKDFESVFMEALTKYQKSVEIMLQGCFFYVQNRDFKKIEEIIARVKNLEYGNSRRFYGDYLQYRGILLAVNGKAQEAASHFKKALEINESIELRSKIASLESDVADHGIKQLILESQSVQFMDQAKKYIGEKKWELAFTKAINAVDALPSYYPAQLLLAKLQADQGYFKQSIELLEALRKDNPTNSEINTALLLTYSHAFKLDKANSLISSLNSVETITNTSDYAAAVSVYYQNKKDGLHAILWLHRAVKINPVNDDYIYKLAQLYQKYNKFDKAKALINRAIFLDPANVNYRLAYASILYETSNVDSAVGYLRSMQKEFPESSQIINEIAIYYYKSGQIKNFSDLKNEITINNQFDKGLFLFLMRAAQTNGRVDEVIDNAQKYFKISPGDLETRMILAKFLIDNEKYEEALNNLKYVQERLDTYPNLQFYRSKLFLLMGNVGDAVELAKLEIKNNPMTESGYLLLADIYAEEEQFDLAESEYKKAQQVNANSMDALRGLAYIKFKKNQYDVAIDLYKKVITARPDDPNLYLQIGDVYRFIGQNKEAVENYKIYLKLDTESKLKDKIMNYIKTIN